MSHAIDDVAAPSTQYQQRSWNWHSIFPQQNVLTTSYPLFAQPLSTSAVVSDASVSAGGAAFYKVTLSANGSAVFTLNTGALPNANVQLVVVRTK